MTELFVDTSAFFALVDAHDANHRVAKKFLRAISRQPRGLVTTTDIFDESLTLVRYRVGHPQALAFGSNLLASKWCRILEVTTDTRDLAWTIFGQYRDHSFSFTDCTSFATMRTMRLTEAFTFDRRDFAAAGLLALPHATGD